MKHPLVWVRRNKQLGFHVEDEFPPLIMNALNYKDNNLPSNSYLNRSWTFLWSLDDAIDSFRTEVCSITKAVIKQRVFVKIFSLHSKHLSSFSFSISFAHLPALKSEHLAKNIGFLLSIPTNLLHEPPSIVRLSIQTPRDMIIHFDWSSVGTGSPTTT